MELKNIRSLIEVESLIKEAMKEKQADILSVLRLIKAKVVFEEKNDGQPLSEEAFIGVLADLIKEHRDSIEKYSKAKRSDLVEAEENELKILTELTPGASFSEDDLITCAKEEIERVKVENGSISMKDMRPIMDRVKEKFKFADGKLISNIVKENILNS